MQNFNVKGIDRVKIAYPGFSDRLGLVKKGSVFSQSEQQNGNTILDVMSLHLWIIWSLPIVSCFNQSNIVSSPQNCVFSTGWRWILILWCCVSFTDQKVWLLGCISQTQTHLNSHKTCSILFMQNRMSHSDAFSQKIRMFCWISIRPKYKSRH